MPHENNTFNKSVQQCHSVAGRANARCCLKRYMPMKYVSNIQDKIELIQKSLSYLIGCEISGYEIAKMWCEEDQEWSDWMNLSISLTD